MSTLQQLSEQFTKLSQIGSDMGFVIDDCNQIQTQLKDIKVDSKGHQELLLKSINQIKLSLKNLELAFNNISNVEEEIEQKAIDLV
jgi:hypothetical protein